MQTPFISEATIESISEKINESRNSIDQAISDMQAKQPVLFSYYFSDGLKLLTSEEREYLLYLGLIIWQTISASIPDLPLVSAEIIESAEEENWQVLNDSNAKKFREKLDIFFKSYPQEDLLAFVEDAMVDDEDTFVTKEGRELLFISLKTSIDVLCGIKQ